MDGHETRIDEIHQEAWSGFLAAHARAVHHLDAEMGRLHGLSAAECEALAQIAAAGGRLAMGQIATLAGLSKSGATRLVDRLVVREWLQRQASPDDSRSVVAVFTAAGQHRWGRAGADYARLLDQVFASRVMMGEARMLAGMLKRIGPEPTE
jgi:DNA-binding MarR family transcriptional regulator